MNQHACADEPTCMPWLHALACITQQQAAGASSSCCMHDYEPLCTMQDAMLNRCFSGMYPISDMNSLCGAGIVEHVSM
jgi:hypothetical protein